MDVTLETERLILRPVDPERDFDAWAAAMADANTMRYLGAPPMNGYWYTDRTGPLVQAETSNYLIPVNQS